MGDPGKSRSKYKGPRHPWEAVRIKEETSIQKEYGLKNKTEIWKASSELRRLSVQAKNLIRQRSKGVAQFEIEQKQLLGRLLKLGLVEEGVVLEDVLALQLRDILDRRLQTFVIKSGLAMTPKQARQFIVHGHIMVDGKKVTIPSYLISRDEQFKIEFKPTSSLSSEEHPERVKKNQVKNKAEKKQETVEEIEAVKPVDELNEKELEKIEKEIVAEVAEE